MRLQETRNKLRAELQTIGTFNMQDKRTKWNGGCRGFLGKLIGAAGRSASNMGL